MQVFGLGADCAANSLGKIPKTIRLKGVDYYLMFPEKFNLPPLMSSEFYFYKLMEQADKEMKQQKQNRSQNGEEGEGSDENSGKTYFGENCGEPKEASGSSGKDKDQKQDSKEQDGKSESSGQSSGKGSGKGNQNQNEGQETSETGGAVESASKIKNHDKWIDERISDTSSFSRKTETFIQDIARESLKECQARGTVPGFINEMVNELLKPPQLPYYQIIRKLVRSSRISKFIQSSTRINRKRTYLFATNAKHIPQISPFPGKKRDFAFSIGNLIDTSSSMPISSIYEGLSGIKNIIENDRHCKTTVIECDARIQKEYQVKKVSDIQPDIKGRGGTTLFPALERFKELKVDIVLAFTDGWCEHINSIDRKFLPKKIVWVITRGGTDEHVDKTGFIINLSGR